MLLKYICEINKNEILQKYLFLNIFDKQDMKKTATNMLLVVLCYSLSIFYMPRPWF